MKGVITMNEKEVKLKIKNYLLDKYGDENGNIVINGFFNANVFELDDENLFNEINTLTEHQINLINEDKDLLYDCFSVSQDAWENLVRNVSDEIIDEFGYDELSDGLGYDVYYKLDEMYEELNVKFKTNTKNLFKDDYLVDFIIDNNPNFDNDGSELFGFEKNSFSMDNYDLDELENTKTLYENGKRSLGFLKTLNFITKSQGYKLEDLFDSNVFEKSNFLKTFRKEFDDLNTNTSKEVHLITKMSLEDYFDISYGKNLENKSVVFPKDNVYLGIYDNDNYEISRCNVVLEKDLIIPVKSIGVSNDSNVLNSLSECSFKDYKLKTSDKNIDLFDTKFDMNNLYNVIKEESKNLEKNLFDRKFGMKVDFEKDFKASESKKYNLIRDLSLLYTKAYEEDVFKKHYNMDFISNDAKLINAIVKKDYSNLPLENSIINKTVYYIANKTDNSKESLKNELFKITNDENKINRYIDSLEPMNAESLNQKINRDYSNRYKQDLNYESMVNIFNNMNYYKSSEIENYTESHIIDTINHNMNKLVGCGIIPEKIFSVEKLNNTEKLKDEIIEYNKENENTQEQINQNINKLK